MGNENSQSSAPAGRPDVSLSLLNLQAVQLSRLLYSMPTNIAIQRTSFQIPFILKFSLESNSKNIFDGFQMKN